MAGTPAQHFSLCTACALLRSPPFCLLLTSSFNRLALLPCLLPCCSAPTVSIAPDLTSAAVSVVAPTAAPPNGWQKYVLRVCPINRAGTCFERDCTPVKTPPAATTCQLADLDEGTKYSLRVTAVQGSYAAPAPLKYFTTATQE